MLSKPPQEYMKDKQANLHNKLLWLFTVDGVKQYKQNNRNEYLRGKLQISSFLPPDITNGLPRKLDDLQLSPDFYFPGGLELCKIYIPNKDKYRIINSENLQHLPRDMRPQSVQHLSTAISNFQESFIQCWRVISHCLDEDLDEDFTQTEQLPWFSNNEIKQWLNYLIVKIAWEETGHKWNRLDNGIVWDCPTPLIKKEFIDILCSCRREDGIPDNILFQDFRDFLDSITDSDSLASPASPAFGRFHTTDVMLDDVSQISSDDEQASLQGDQHSIRIPTRPQQQRTQDQPSTSQATVSKEAQLLQAMQQQPQLHTTAHQYEGLVPGACTLRDQTMMDVMEHISHPQQQRTQDQPSTSQATVSEEVQLLQAMQQQPQLLTEMKDWYPEHAH